MMKLPLILMFVLYVFDSGRGAFIHLTDLHEMPEHAIISKISVGSQMQCALRCKRNKLCAHAGYKVDAKMCVLIGEVHKKNVQSDEPIQKLGLGKANSKMLEFIDPQG